MSNLAKILKREFKNRSYKYGYVEGHLDCVIAAQLKVLREQRGWTQAQMGKKIGTTQSGYARIENCNYGRWSLAILRRCAEAFDLRLKVTFENFDGVAAEVKKFGRVNLQRK